MTPPLITPRGEEAIAYARALEAWRDDPFVYFHPDDAGLLQYGAADWSGPHQGPRGGLYWVSTTGSHRRVYSTENPGGRGDAHKKRLEEGRQQRAEAKATGKQHAAGQKQWEQHFKGKQAQEAAAEKAGRSAKHAAAAHQLVGDMMGRVKAGEAIGTEEAVGFSQQLLGHLQEMTVKDIQALKERHGLKASGVKAQLALKVAAAALRPPGGSPAGEPPGAGQPAAPAAAGMEKPAVPRIEKVPPTPGMEWAGSSYRIGDKQFATRKLAQEHLVALKEEQARQVEQKAQQGQQSEREKAAEEKGKKALEVQSRYDAEVKAELKKAGLKKDDKSDTAKKIRQRLLEKYQPEADAIFGRTKEQPAAADGGPIAADGGGTGERAVGVEQPPTTPDKSGQQPTAPASGAGAKQPHELTREEFGKNYLVRGYVPGGHSWHSKEGMTAAGGKASPAHTAQQDWNSSFPRLFGNRPGGKIALFPRNAEKHGSDLYDDVLLSGEQPSHELPGDIASDPHRHLVEAALAAGKPVPPEVLAGYPDLAAKQQPAAPQSPTAAKPTPSASTPKTAPATPATVVDAARKVERDLGNRPVGFREFYQHIPPNHRAAVDHELFAMADRGDITLHEHDHPGSLSPQERTQLLQDPRSGKYYTLFGFNQEPPSGSAAKAPLPSASAPGPAAPEKPVPRQPHEWWNGLSKEEKKAALESVNGYLGPAHERNLGRSINMMDREVADQVKEAHTKALYKDEHRASPASTTSPATPVDTKALRKSLAESPIRSMARITGPEAGGHEAQLVTLADGKQGVFKPGRLKHLGSGSEMDNDVAASDVANALGLGDLVPQTVIRHAKGGDLGHEEVGSLQTFVPGAKSGESLQREGQGAGAFGGDHLPRAAAFDYLIGVGDRHAKNWLVAPDGKPVLIDNTNSFPGSGSGVGMQSDLVRQAHANRLPVPKEAASWDWGKIEPVLKQHGLQPEQIATAKGRFDDLVQAAKQGGDFGSIARVQSRFGSKVPGKPASPESADISEKKQESGQTGLTKPPQNATNTPVTQKPSTGAKAMTQQLPKLTGSEKQVAWADKIRDEATRALPGLAAAAAKVTSASDWIDWKKSPGALLRAASAGIDFRGLPAGTETPNGNKVGALYGSPRQMQTYIDALERSKEFGPDELWRTVERGWFAGYTLPQIVAHVNAYGIPRGKGEDEATDERLAASYKRLADGVAKDRAERLAKSQGGVS